MRKLEENVVLMAGGKRRATAWPDDPRDIPAFTIPEVARSLRMNPDRLSDWLKPREEYGRKREKFGPLITPAGEGSAVLSFHNALEAHILLATLRIHKVSMLNVRRAVNWVSREWPSAHPLVDYKFQTDGRYLFVSRLIEGRDAELKEEGATEEEIYNASLQGQGAINEIVYFYLKRIERTEAGLAHRLFPIVPGSNNDAKPVMMDLDFASGQLVIAQTGVAASVVYGRFEAGHSIETLARDYRLSPEQIHGAIQYFQAAA